MSDSSNRVETPSKSRGPGLGIAVGVIVGVIVLALIIFVVIWTTRGGKTKKPDCLVDADCASGQLCRNEKCVAAPTCIAPPASPGGVNVVYDRNAGTATVSWVVSTGASVYTVYRKLNDPAVGKNNYDEKKSVSGTSQYFSSLAHGTHYFVVTASNDCGDSDESSPSLMAASCDVVPDKPGAPVISQTADHCSDPQMAEYNEIAHDEATGSNPFNIIKGNGQFGVSDYFAVFPSPTGNFEVALTCSESPVSYTATSVSVADYANLQYPTGPMTVGASVAVTWDPVLNAEEYAVVLVTVDSNGTFMFTGGTTTAPVTHLDVKTLAGSTLAYASVVGYRLCDKSAPSAAGYHITP